MSTSQDRAGTYDTERSENPSSLRRAFALGLAGLALFACTRPNENAPSASSEPAPNPSASAAPQAAAPKKGAITIKGSDTMVLLGQRWSEAFMKAHPDVTIQVTGGGSGVGIAALINGTTDIAEASRPMKPKEKDDLKAKSGKETVETKVAIDALAVYVHPKNSLEEVTLAQLAKAYRGEAKTWKDIGGMAKPLVLYGRENSSGTYAYFKEHVLENKDFAAATQTLSGTSAVVAAVEKDPNGIGYGGFAYTKGVRPLKVKKDESSPAIAPSKETALDGTYPLARFLYFYTAGEPTGSAKEFIEWVQGAEGQALVDKVGYFPLKEAEKVASPEPTPSAAPSAAPAPTPSAGAATAAKGTKPKAK